METAGHPDGEWPGYGDKDGLPGYPGNPPCMLGSGASFMGKD